MSSKSIYAQYNIQIKFDLDPVPSGFIGLAPKSDGMYLRKNGESSVRLLTTNDSSGFIQNQFATVQTANFKISGDAVVMGKMGIGTETPLVRLQIDDAAGAVIRANSGTRRIQYGAYAGDANYNTAIGASYYLGTEDNNALYLLTNNVARLNIGSAGDFAFNTTQLYIAQSTGNVGIGTAAPIVRLQIDDAAGAVIRANSGTRRIQYGAYAGDANYNTAIGASYYLGTEDNNALYLLTNNVARLNIGSAGDIAFNTNQLFVQQTTGNVGIGTATPTSKLTIAGDASATNYISTIAIGTAPLTVTSTTLVINLNADLIDGKHSTDFALSGHTHQGWLFTSDGVNTTPIGDPTICTYHGISLIAGSNISLTPSSLIIPGVGTLVQVSISSTGSTNYWQRTGTTLSQATANDRVQIDSNVDSGYIFAVQGSVDYSTCILGSHSGAGTGLHGFSSSGIAGRFESTTGTPLYASINPATTNTSEQVLSLYRFTSGSSAVGIGAYIGFYIQSTSQTTIAGKFGTVLTNVGTDSQSAKFQWALISGGTINITMELSSTGILYIPGSYARVTGSNVTTSSTSLVNITGLSIALLANETYEFEAVLGVSNSNDTSGVRYGINFSASGATLYAHLSSIRSGQIAYAERMTAFNTQSSMPYLNQANITGTAFFKGIIVVGANPGNLTIQHLKITSGTSTVFIGSFLKVRRLA